MTYISEFCLTAKDFISIYRQNHHRFDLYTAHKLVYSLFPEKDKDVNKFLYLDLDLRGYSKEKKILLVSDMKPLTPEVGYIRTEALPDEFLSKEFYRFEILVSPTKKDKETKKFKAIRFENPDEQKKWFCEVGKRHGFEVISETLQIPYTDTQIIKKGTTKITMGRAFFSGCLRVTDQQYFMQAFRQGIGREKAFGCGLLRVVPMKQASVDAE